MNNYEQNNQNMINNNGYNYNNQNMMNNNGYNYNDNKQPLSYYIKRFLIGLLLVIAIIFLLLYLFPTKNGLKDLISDAMDETITEKLNPFYDRIFSDSHLKDYSSSIKLLQVIACDTYFGILPTIIVFQNY